MTARFVSWQTYYDRQRAIHEQWHTYLAEEPSDKVSKDNCFVGLVVAIRAGNAGNVPKITLPLVQESVGGGGVEEQDARGTLNQPAAVESSHASVVHGLYGGGKMRVFGLELLDLDGSLRGSAAQWRTQGDKLTEALFQGPSRV